MLGLFEHGLLVFDIGLIGFVGFGAGDNRGGKGQIFTHYQSSNLHCCDYGRIGACMCYGSSDPTQAFEHRADYKEELPPCSCSKGVVELEKEN